MYVGIVEDQRNLARITLYRVTTALISGSLGPSIVLATHSTEIISEVEAEAILNINKRFRSARRIQNTHDLQDIFSNLGSNLNPTLTQLAKTKRAIFVEGKDFQILSRFARKLGLETVANRSYFAVVPVEGFNPQKVKDFASGMELTLGTKLVKVVIFDRDYRCEAEAQDITTSLSRFCWYAVVHDRKEIENYLLHPAVLSRVIRKKLAEREMPFPESLETENLSRLLMDLSESLKNKVQAQMVTARQLFERRLHPTLHTSNVSQAAMDEFDRCWSVLTDRMKVIPGKEMLSVLNRYLQEKHGCALTPGSIIDAFQRSEIWPELMSLLSKLSEVQKVMLDDHDESTQQR